MDMYKKTDPSIINTIFITASKWLMEMFKSDIKTASYKFIMILSFIWGGSCILYFSYIYGLFSIIMSYSEYITYITYFACVAMVCYILHQNNYQNNYILRQDKDNKEYSAKKYHEGLHRGGFQGFVIGNFSGYGIGWLENIIRNKWFS